MIMFVCINFSCGLAEVHVLSHCSSCILILWPNIGSAGGTPSPRISISMENNFSVPCPEIMGTHL